MRKSKQTIYMGYKTCVQQYHEKIECGVTYNKRKKGLDGKEGKFLVMPLRNVEIMDSGKSDSDNEQEGDHVSYMLKKELRDQGLVSAINATMSSESGLDGLDAPRAMKATKATKATKDTKATKAIKAPKATKALKTPTVSKPPKDTMATTAMMAMKAAKAKPPQALEAGTPSGSKLSTSAAPASKSPAPPCNV
jgi:hypothetical protein